MAAGETFSAPERILVLKPSSLGDIVHTLPAVAALRARWPQSEIAWLINPEWAPLLEGNPEVDRVIEFPRRQFRGLAGWRRIPAWLSSLGGWTPDLAVDFQGLLRTALIARFMGAKKIIGLADAREGAGFFYHRTVRLPRGPIHAVERYLRLVEALDVGEIARPVFHLPAGNRPTADLPEDFILLHPFSRGAGKSMENSALVQLCRDVHPRPVVLVGGARAMENLPDNVANLLGKTTLLELIWLIRHAKFVVSVDSGPMHIAAALTENLLSIHTWSDPVLVGPYNPAAWIWKNGSLCRRRDYQPIGKPKTEAPTSQAIVDFLSQKG